MSSSGNNNPSVCQEATRPDNQSKTKFPKAVLGVDRAARPTTFSTLTS